MNDSKQATAADHELLRKAFEVTIRLTVVAALVIWCVLIFRPFLMPFIWGAIIAVALYKAFLRLRGVLGGRDGLAGAAFSIILLAILFVPTVQIVGSVVDSSQLLADRLQAGDLKVPPPDDRVQTWPLIGQQLYDFWTLASSNLEAALQRISPQLRDLGAKLLSLVAALGKGVAESTIAIIIAGFLLAYAKSGYSAATSLTTRLSGERGTEYVDVIGATIRSVAQGVLGVAIVQSLLAGAGLFVAQVPGAGIWTLLILLLAIMQLPPLLVLGPIVVWYFSASDSTVVATIFAIWSLLVSVSDTFLKPMFLGRGVAIPMPVILIGAIGGMILSGFIGLFVGAIVLAVGYKLFRAWMEEESAGAVEQADTA